MLVTFRRALLSAVLLAAATTPLGAQSAPSPEEHFGFAMGTARQLARWDEILDYFTIVADRSDRVRVDTLGPTTLGNPYVVVTMSSPANLARLGRIREASAELAAGRLGRTAAEELAGSIPATAVLHHNIHSTEIGASQTSVDLVHRLATASDASTLQILDNVVTVLIPSGNPDGQIMVTDWYRRNVGTDFEDARMPYLYHHYAGHDNNRDFFQGNLIETRHWMDVMFRQAHPQVYLDQHQMGSTGPRIFVPPYPDPMDPDIHPLQWQSLQAMGGGIVADLQREGMQGVITGRMYRIWGQEGALTGRHHNIVALLTETASADIASPVTVTREELEQGARRLGPGARYGFGVDFADPWWGGEWTLADIVAYQTVAAVSFLDQTARFRERYLMGRWQMASETIDAVRKTGPFAFVIPADQSDPVTAADLARRLALQGILVEKASQPFTGVASAPRPRPQDGDPHTLSSWMEGEDSLPATTVESDEHEDGAEVEASPRTFPAGSWIIPAAQPGWAAIEDLLVPQERELLREYPDGPFLRSYDGAGYTMTMQMGVELVMVSDPIEVTTTRVSHEIEPLPWSLPAAETWYALSTAVNESYRVANALAAEGIAVSRTHDNFLVSAVDPRAVDRLRSLASVRGVPVTADPGNAASARDFSPARTGLYQGWAGAMDEGWTRLLLEEYGFAPITLTDDDVRAPDLGSRFDVVIIPSEISLDRLVEGADEDDAPEGYRGGIGEEGVESLKRFVREGGTLVTLDRGDAVVLEHFDVPVRDGLEDAGSRDFFAPASIFRVELDPDHPLSAGSPREVAAKWAGGRAYEPDGWSGASGPVRVVGRWAPDPDRVLMSGLLVGADRLADRAAVLEVDYGRGRIVMFGFRVQHRAQTAGTFKLLFNALLHDGGRPAT